MLPYVCPVIDHRWGQNVERTKKWHTGAAECATNVLTTFWRLLWSIYTHVIIECFGFTRYQEKILLTVTSSIRLSFNRSQLRTNQNTYTIVYLGSLSTKTPSSPEFVIMCHISCLSVPSICCEEFYLWTTSLDCKYFIPSATSLGNRIFLQFNSNEKKQVKNHLNCNFLLGHIHV